MKKVLFAAAMAAALLSACSQNEVFDSRAENNAIEFGTYTAMPTKASGLVSGNVFPDGGKMGVFAYYTANTAWDGTASPNFMFNQLVTKSGDAYNYSPTKYWPNNAGDKITFFAYYPYDAAGLSWNDHATPTAAAYNNASANLPVAVLDIQGDAKDQVDFMYAVVKDKTKTAGNDSVQFTFKHALTQVNLKAKLAAELIKDNGGTASNTTVTITGIKFKNIYKSGTLDIAAGTPVWTASNPVDFAAALSNDSGVVINGTTPQTVTANTETFVMMPQTLQSNAAIEVTYKVKTIDAALKDGYSEVTNTTSAKISGLWTANGNVLYTLTIGLNDIKVTADITAWDVQDDGTIANN